MLQLTARQGEYIERGGRLAGLTQPTNHLVRAETRAKCVRFFFRVFCFLSYYVQSDPEIQTLSANAKIRPYHCSVRAQQQALSEKDISLFPRPFGSSANFSIPSSQIFGPDFSPLRLHRLDGCDLTANSGMF